MFFHLNRGGVNDFLVVAFALINSFIILSDDLRFMGMVVIFLLSMITFFLGFSLNFKIERGTFYLGVFVLVSLINVLYFPSLTSYAENKRIYFYFTLLIVFLLCSASDVYYRNYNIIFWGLFFVGVVYFFISVGFKPSEENARVNELGLNPLILAKNVALLGVLSLFLPNKKYSYLLFYIALLGVVATGSRGPFVILLLILLMKFIFEKKYFYIFLSSIAILFVIFFYDFFLSILPETFSSRLTGDSMRYQFESNSGAERIDLYRIAYNLWESNPIFGIGLGNYSYFAPLNAPHNIYLEMLAEMGVFFFVAFVFFILSSLYCGFVCIKRFNDCKLKGLFFVYIFFVLSMLIDGELTVQCFLLYYLGFIFLNIYYRRSRLC